MLENITFIIFIVLLAMVFTLWLSGERWRPLLPSTWKVMKEGGLRRFLNLDGLHAYIYGRWTNQYVNVFINHIPSRLVPLVKKWLPDRYHGKVLTTEQAKAIVTLDSEIPRRDLEQIIPYPMARDLVLKGPPDVAIYECACRHARAHPCQPTQVCMVIGQPFVDFVLEHHPTTSRKISQKEAIALLQAEYERGHLHSAWFKDVCMGRFYAICNCCKCCCGGIEVMRKYNAPMIAPSGYVAQPAEDLCTACGNCVDPCPFDALSVNDKSVVLDWIRCMGCGICVGQCPNEAITMVRDENKGVPLDVRLLVAEKDDM